MSERGHGHALHVVRRDEVAAGERGAAARELEQREDAARARADRDARALARRRDELDDVAADARRRRGRPRPRAASRAGSPGRRPAELDLVHAPVEPPLEHLPLVVGRSGSRTRFAAGSGRAAPPAAGRCPRTRSGSASRGRGTAARAACVVPSTVTWRSCIASSSAACVFGGARLISSASRRLAKIGPGRNSNSSVALVPDRRAGDVGREQIGRELHAREAEAGDRRERARRQRLCEPGDVLEQHVPVGEQAREHELEQVALADDGALDLVEHGRRACAASSISSMRGAPGRRRCARCVAIAARARRGRRVPDGRRGRAPSARRRGASRAFGRSSRSTPRAESSSAAIERSVGRSRKWTSNAVPAASVTSRSMRSRDAGRARVASRRRERRSNGDGAPRNGAVQRCRARRERDREHERRATRADERARPGTSDEHDAGPALTASDRARPRGRSASRAAPRRAAPRGRPRPRASSSLHLLERVDRLVLHLGTHIVVGELRPREQRRQAPAARRRQLDLARTRSRYSSGASASRRGTPWAASTRSSRAYAAITARRGSLSARRSSSVVVEHVLERRRGRRRRRSGAAARSGAPNQPHASPRPRAAPGRRRPGQTANSARSASVGVVPHAIAGREPRRAGVSRRSSSCDPGDGADEHRERAASESDERDDRLRAALRRFGAPVVGVLAAEERQRDGDEHGAHDHQHEEEADEHVEKPSDGRRALAAAPVGTEPVEAIATTPTSTITGGATASAPGDPPRRGAYRPCRETNDTTAERLSRPTVMGVVNVTPDSFSDGGAYASAEDAARLRGGCSPTEPRSSTSVASRPARAPTPSRRRGAPSRACRCSSCCAGRRVSIDTSRGGGRAARARARRRAGERRHGAARRPGARRASSPSPARTSA